MLEDRRLLAVGPQLVRDINTSTASSHPSGFTSLGDAALFVANNQLWKADVVSGQADLVKEFGSSVSHASIRSRLGSGLLLSVRQSGRAQLWITDGSTQGTAPVSSEFLELGGGVTAIDDQYFFVARPDNHDRDQLWKTDGTPLGTSVVHTIRSDGIYANIRELVVLQDTVMFVADDGLHGSELWRSDGTTAGTALVKDIVPYDPQFDFNDGSHPKLLTVVGDKLFFSANHPQYGEELWVSDGTEAGTRLVKDIYPGESFGVPNSSWLNGFIAHEGQLFFSADDGVAGQELWRSDGTSEGTVLVADIASGSQGSSPMPIRSIHGRLLFAADDGEHGRELWVTDGTSVGTELVKDLELGPGSGLSNYWIPSAVFNGTLLIESRAGETWVTDGTTLGTYPFPIDLLKHIASGYANVSGMTIFAGSNDAAGIEPWVTDGTVAGTRLYQDINSTNLGSAGNVIFDVNGQAYFDAFTPEFGQELWISDGSEDGTRMIVDANPGRESSVIHDWNSDVVFPWKDRVLFTTSHGHPQIFQLWKTDGTESTLLGTFPRLFDTGFTSRPYGFVEFGDYVYFSATSNNAGRELWRTDGTPAGTLLVKDIRPGPTGSAVHHLVVSHDTLYFAVFGVGGYAIWKSDGSEQGTAEFRPFDPHGLYAPTTKLVSLDEHLYFFGRSESQVTQLFRSDGTESGTHAIADIETDMASGSISQITPVGQTIFFLVDGHRLWRTDGTAAGTLQLMSFRKNSSFGPDWLTAVGDRLYLAVPAAMPDNGLWLSDGTVEGTIRVANAQNASDLTAVDETLYYIDARKIWRSNGTEQTTVEVADFSSGSLAKLTLVGDDLFFFADDRVHGRELWRLPVSRSVPDLQVSNLNLSVHSGVIAETLFDVSWQVSNVGQSDASGGWIDRVYLSRDGVLDTSDWLLAERSVPPGDVLQAGQTIDMQAQFTIPVSLDLPAGDYQVIVVTDSLGQIADLDRSNNSSTSDVVTLALPPLPDLIVSEIQLPTQAFAGHNIPVAWSLHNQGTASMMGTWSDHVRLSLDDQLGDDQTLAEFNFSGTIAPGETVRRTQSIQVDHDQLGPYWVVIESLTANTTNEVFYRENNASISTHPIDLQLLPTADLIVTDVVYPSELFSGREATIQWVVRNQGTASTNAPYWYDHVYLNDSASLQNATYIGRALNPAYLAAGESYQNSATVSLPRERIGSHFLIIVADGSNHVFELNAEDNNWAAGGATAIQASPAPDLVASALLAPQQAFSGQPISVTFEVSNVGEDDLRHDPFWGDFLWLSDQPELTDQSILLNWSRNAGLPGPGETYRNFLSAQLPNHWFGDSFLVLAVDGWDDVYERGREANNHLAVPLSIRLTPPPDLEVLQFNAPANPQAAQEVTFTYQIANLGSKVTDAVRWHDQLWFSADDVWDESDTLLATIPHVGALEVNDSYTVTHQMTLPRDLGGDGYFFIVANVNEVFWEADRFNNQQRSPTTIAPSDGPADLFVTSVNAPASATAGHAILVDWTVINQGLGTTNVSSWDDALILSKDGIIGNQDDIFLKHVVRNGSLAKDEIYQVRNHLVEIPYEVEPGDYQLFVFTDSKHRVFEGNGGVATTNNALTRTPIRIDSATADLTVTRFSAPSSGSAASEIGVMWSVENAGLSSTRQTWWVDHLYLSTDPILDEGDVLLGKTRRTNPLAAGESYQREEVISLPPEIEGRFYLLVLADGDNQVIERSGGGKQNNVSTALPIDIDLPRSPDLQLVEVISPTVASAGRELALQWRVRNDSETAIDQSSWIDAVYLSTDQVFDPEFDRLLGYIPVNQSLAAGAEYSANANFSLPLSLGGPHYVFVSVDHRQQIYEGGNDLNNLGYATTPLEIVVPPPVDLVAGVIRIPDSAIAGQDISLTYSVSNQSSTDLVGTWQDSLYLSRNPIWDLQDAWIGDVANVAQTVRAGDTYTRTLTAPLPGVVPGDYYVIVRADIRNQIAEAIESNNWSASIDTTAVDFPSLVLGVATDATLAPGRALYYQVDVPADATLEVRVESNLQNAENRLYAARNRVPTPADHDFASLVPFAANQSVRIPSTSGETYYVMVVATADSANIQAVQVAADTIPFSIADTGYGIAGNAGQVTLPIRGARFHPQVQALMRDQAGSVRSASQIWPINETLVYATFDLRGLVPADYDIVLENPDGQRVFVAGGLQVVKGGGSFVKSEISVAAAVRRETPYAFGVSWSNRGINDAPAPLMWISSDGVFGLAPGRTEYNQGYIFLGAPATDGPAGLLRPNQSQTENLFGMPSGDRHEISSARILADADAPVDWERLATVIEVVQASAPSRFDFLAHLRTTYTTNRQLAEAFGEWANLMPSELGDPRSVEDLLAFSQALAIARSGTHIHGTLSRQSFATKSSNQRVDLISTAGQIVDQAVSLNDGSFILGPVAEGHYRLVVRSLDSAFIAEQSIIVDAGITRLTPVIAIEASGRVVARIAESVTGRSIVGATVELVNDRETLLSSRTDRFGQSVFTDLAAGEYRIVVKHPDFAPLQQAAVFVEAGETTVWELELVDDARLRIAAINEQGESIGDFGVILVPQDADVTATSPHHIYGSQATLTGLPAGVFDVILVKQGYASMTIPGIQLTSGQRYDLGQVSFQRGLMLRGEITDLRVGVLENLVLTIREFDSDVPVAMLPVREGQFEIPGPLPAGKYIIDVSDPTLIFEPLVVEGVSGETVDDLSMIIFPGAEISGRVTDTTGAALSDVAVELIGLGEAPYSTVTASDGTYRFVGLPHGLYRVALEKSSVYADVQVEELLGKVHRVDLETLASQVVSGVVRGPSGDPVAGALVRLLDGDRIVAVTSTNAHGEYRYAISVNDVPLRVSAIDDEYVFAPRTIPTMVTMVSDLDFAPGDHALTIRLTGLTDPGDFHGEIRLIGPDQQLLVRSLDGVDEVHFGHLVGGLYRVTVATATGETTSQAVAVTGTSSQATLRLEPAYRLAGVLRDSQDNGLGGVLLILRDASGDDLFRTFTQADGSYEFIAVPARDYILEAVGNHVAYQRIATITVSSNLQADWNAQTGTHFFHGRVLHADGDPIAGAIAVAVDASGATLAVSASDQQGYFALPVEPSEALSVAVYAPGFSSQTFLATSSQTSLGQATEFTLRAIAVSTTGQATREGSAVGLTMSGVGEGDLIDIIGDRLQQGFFGLLDIVLTPRKSSAHVVDGALMSLPQNCGDKCRGLTSKAQQAIASQNRAWENYVSSTQIYRASWLEEKATAFQLTTEMIQDAASIAAPLLRALKGIKAIERFLSASKAAELWKLGTDFTEFAQQLLKTSHDIPNSSSAEDGVAIGEDGFRTLVQGLSTLSSFRDVLTSQYDHLRHLKAFDDLLDAGPEMLGAIGAIFNIMDNYQRNFDQYMKLMREMRSLERKAEEEYAKYERAAQIASSLTARANACIEAVLSDVERYCKIEERPDDEDDRDPVRFVASMDPNDIIGPEGFGEERWVSVHDTLAYRIRFENDPVFATAPAQQVMITQMLDSDLDVRSFRLGDFGFGDQVIKVPEDRAYFSDQIDLMQSHGIILAVFAGVDVMTREAFWHFTSIDPATAQRPQNPLIGFLPPNLTAPEGDGFVNYTIRPRRDATTGTVIDAQARIIFDENPPIDTPPIFNTIDASAPTSAVSLGAPIVSVPAPLPLLARFASQESISTLTTSQNTVDSTFLVQWQGVDDRDGSAIDSYTVFVSSDRGPYEVWLEDTRLTQAPFVGEPGRSYAFYSLAKDFAGQIQSVPDRADLIVTLPGAPGINFALSDQPLQIESGGFVDIPIRLTSIPTAEVTLQIRADNASETLISPSTIQFSADDWDSIQTVRVTLQNNHLIEEDVAFDLILDSSTSSANEYATLVPTRIGLVHQGGQERPVMEGTIWADANGDGLRQASEAGVPDVLVRLLNHDAGVVRESITDSQGNYSFTGDLLSTSYSLMIVVADGYALTEFGVGTDDTINSDFDPANRRTRSFTLESAQPLQFDAGLIGLATIEGVLWNDFNGDGIADPQEPGLPGRMVFLDLNENGIHDADEPSRRTDALGRYTFDDLYPGTYSVVQQLPAGWLLSQPHPFVDVSQHEHAHVTAGGSRFDSREQLFSIRRSGSVVGEDGRTIEIQIRLETPPSHPVQISASTDAPATFILSNTSLQFDATNWNQDQTILISTSDNDIADGNVFGTLRLFTDDLSDHRFANWELASWTIVKLDNDQAGVVIEQTDGSTFIAETGMADYFSVRLSARPIGEVTLTLSSLMPQVLDVAPAQLVFTPDDWDRSRDVEIRISQGQTLPSAVETSLFVKSTSEILTSNYNTLSTVQLPLQRIDLDHHVLHLRSDGTAYELFDSVTNVTLRREELTDTPIHLVTGSRGETIRIDADFNPAVPFTLDTGDGSDWVELLSPPTFEIKGGAGVNTLAIRFATSNAVVNLDHWNIQEFERIDLRSNHREVFMLSAQQARRLTPASGLLKVFADSIDEMRLATDWVLSGRGMGIDEPFHRLVASDVELHLYDQSPWTNPIIAEDVNGDGNVTSLDALLIINLIAREGTGSTPLDHLALTVNRYYDVSDDGQLTAIDALRVINALARQNVLASGEQVVATTTMGPPSGIQARRSESHAGHRFGRLSCDDTFAALDQSIIQQSLQATKFEALQPTSPGQLDEDSWFAVEDVRIRRVDAILSDWAQEYHAIRLLDTDL